MAKVRKVHAKEALDPLRFLSRIVGIRSEIPVSQASKNLLAYFLGRGNARVFDDLVDRVGIGRDRAQSIGQASVDGGPAPVIFFALRVVRISRCHLDWSDAHAILALAFKPVGGRVILSRERSELPADRVGDEVVLVGAVVPQRPYDELILDGHANRGCCDQYSLVDDPVDRRKRWNGWTLVGSEVDHASTWSQPHLR